MDGLRAVPPLGGPQAADFGRFGNPYIPKASLPRLGLAGGDHSPCRGNNAPRCLYSDGRSAFAPAIVRCGPPEPGARTAKKDHFLPMAHSGPGSLGRLCRAAHWRACPSTALPHGTPASLALAPGGDSVGLSSLPHRFVPRRSSVCVAAARIRPAPAQRRRVPHGGTPRLLLLADRPFGLTTLARSAACLGGGLPAGSRASESQLIAGGSRAISPVRGAPLRRENSQGYAPASLLPCSFFSVALLRPVGPRGLRRLRHLATPVLFGACVFVRTRREQVPPVRPQPAPEPKQSGAPPISPQSCLRLPPASASSVCRVARPGARLR